MNSVNGNVSKRFNKISHRIKRALFITLAAALAFPVTLPLQSSRVHAEVVGTTSTYIDKIVFGNEISEQEHHFVGEFTSAIVGGLGETARRSEPRVPVTLKGGDLIFTMNVDPNNQNYLTVKFWGEDASSYKSIVYINGEQLGSRRSGDFEPLNYGNENYRAGTGTPTTGAKTLQNRFYYRTTMLPLESTYGQETVEITIRTYHESFSNNMTLPSRGYYNAYTHNQAYLDVSAEQQGAKFTSDVNTLLAIDNRTAAEKQALIDGYTNGQRALFNSLSTKSDNGANARLSIVRYEDELKFYASALTYDDWSPANSPALKKAALERIFKTIDNHVKDYYGNTRLVQRGGHQGDWGGYYGALGEALYIVENLIADDEIYGEELFNQFLDQPFVTNTSNGPYSLVGVDWDGGPLTRRGAWERVLKANFDFARSRLSYIFNQVMYTYEGAWKAHEGLRVIGSDFYEGRDRSHAILLESLGGIPFLGEEVLVGPNGEELDLYHSLFYHDTTAQFTVDVEQIVAKGLAKSKLDKDGNIVRRLPLGEHFTAITEAGLTRENGYVANYGESANYLPEYFYKTLNHAGDEQLNDEILKLSLKSIHARGYARYTDIADDGKRVMRMEQVLDDRNSTFSGNYGYATSINGGKALHFASLELAMAQNEQRYRAPEWDDYWQYAQEAVGYVQQQIADNQFFNYFDSLTAKNKYDYEAAKTYRYITTERASYNRFDSVMAGVVHPQTDFSYYTESEIEALGVNPSDYEQFAWIDIDNLYVSLRDGDTRIFGQLNMLNRGFAGNGRLHVINHDHDNIVQIATNGKFQYEDYTIRMNDIDIFMIDDQLKNDGDRPQALAGEINPITYQPGVGKVERENWEPDHVYSGLPDLLTARYGQYFIVFNSTRSVYGNEQPFEVELPADYSGNTVFDLVTGNDVPVIGGKVVIEPKSAMVLKLTADSESSQKPFSVDYVGALAGNGYAGINWKTTSGAESYTIKRSTTENGTYEVIAANLQGNYYKDTTVINGQEYYYKVTAVNSNGAGWDSYRAKLDLTTPVTINDPGTLWRDDRLGDTQGNATIEGSTIRIQNANGSGLGEGDDYKVLERNINDSLHLVSQVVSGSGSIEAKLDSYNGAASGIMMRDLLDSNTRYIYFGADEDGNLVLQNRTRDSRHTFTDLKMSPLNVNLIGFNAVDYPYIKLLRDYDSRFVNAYVSNNGEDWIMIHKLFTPFPYAFYAGVVAADDAQFSEVTVDELYPGIIYPFIERVNNAISLSWNKPKQAITFDVFRTYDSAASLQDPVFVEGTNQLEENSSWVRLASNVIDLSYVDTEPTLLDTPNYKIVPIALDGTYGQFSETVYPAAEAVAPLASNIKVRNNPAGIADTIEVKGLTAGHYVKVYRTKTDTVLLGSAIAEGSTAMISIPQIGQSSGVLFVSISEPNKIESSRTGKTYAGEDGIISKRVEKDATLRFNTAAPANATEMTILSNGANVEDNKRYGIVTFDGLPDFDENEIKSVTLRMFRTNNRDATLRAQLIEWDDWIEVAGNDTLGAKLKAEYFGGSTAAIEAFLAGPYASGGVKLITGYEANNINALWDIDVTDIVKVNEGSRATFLLSVPSAEANPVTKEYVAGQSAPGQFGPILIIKYVVNKSALSEWISTVNGLNADDYTNETWVILQAALTNAEQLMLDGEAEQVEVNTALTNLLAAVDGLIMAEEPELVLDTTALEAVIYRAKSVMNDTYQYTEASFAALQLAIESAEAVLANVDENTVQHAIDDAVAALQTAIDGLVLKEKSGPEPEPSLDTSILAATINKAKSVMNDTYQYTEASFAALQLAIESAEAILANVDENTVQQAIDDAVATLQSAIDALVLTEVPEKPPVNNGGGIYIPAPPETPKNTVIADDVVTNQINNSGTEEVTMSLPVNTDDMSEVIAVIPAIILKSLVVSGKSLKIKSGDVEIIIPAKVLAAASQSTPDNLSIHIQLVKEVSVAGRTLVSNVYDLTLISEKNGETTTISTFNEPITVQIPVPAIHVTDPRKVAGYKINGSKLEYVGGKYVNGKVVFRTRGFSLYAAVEKNITFADITKHWSKDAIEVLASRAIIYGKGVNTFGPEDRLTRAEFAVLIARSLNLPTTPYEGIFQDVTTEKAWAYADIEAVYRAGIIKGRDAATFAPEANITREELATMIIRAIAYADATLLNDLSVTTAFNDALEVSSFAQAASAAAQSLGIINGRPGNVFDPKGSATRAEAAAMLYRALEKLNQF